MPKLRSESKEKLAKIIIPEIGKLYKFRTDNIEFVRKKYNYYYTGLLMCIQTDLLDDANFASAVDGILADRMIKNPIYGFEIYNCIQYYSQIELFDNEGIKIPGPIYLSLYEINDMIEPANSGAGSNV